MEVVKIWTGQEQERHILIDADGEPVPEVLDFLKYKEKFGSSRNTLRSYCHHLLLFFRFLQQHNLDYGTITNEEMADFIRWLKTNKMHNGNVVSISQTPNNKKQRKESTVNLIFSTTLIFYDYLYQSDKYSGKILEQLRRKVSGSRRMYKNFLYHISKNKDRIAKVLKLKVPKARRKVIAKATVNEIVDCCRNIRDIFLVNLLWETSMRIGEALSLWIEDVDIGARKINICDRGELENGAEIKTPNSPRTLDVTAELINIYINYISKYHTDNVDTNHILIKIRGDNKYHPLEYGDVVSLFKRINMKLGIHVMPHMIRHSSLTKLRQLDWQWEMIKERAGHANVSTTHKYIHVSDDELRDAWELVQNEMKLKKQKDDKDD